MNVLLSIKNKCLIKFDRVEDEGHWRPIASRSSGDLGEK